LGPWLGQVGSWPSRSASRLRRLAAKGRHCCRKQPLPEPQSARCRRDPANFPGGCDTFPSDHPLRCPCSPARGPERPQVAQAWQKPGSAASLVSVHRVNGRPPHPSRSVGCPLLNPPCSELAPGQGDRARQYLRALPLLPWHHAGAPLPRWPPGLASDGYHGDGVSGITTTPWDDHCGAALAPVDPGASRVVRPGTSDGPPAAPRPVVRYAPPCG
jgi:hypothetical protein